jgi:hypothetical protein
MLLRLQRYDIHIVYSQGKFMFLADTLSRAFPPATAKHQELEQVMATGFVSISEARLIALRQATETDESLQSLKVTVMRGWPAAKTALDPRVMPYYSVRDEISVQDGLLCRGERVIVPISLRQEMVERTHSSHVGIEACLRRARECLYWPGMNADIKKHVQKCEICSNHQVTQQKETLMSHELDDRPWAKIGTDCLSAMVTIFL